MNKYLFGVVRVVNGCLKSTWNNVIHRTHISLINYISPYTEMTFQKGAFVQIGKGMKMRSGSKIRVRENAHLRIGDHFNMSGSNWITVHKEVVIGSNVSLGPDTRIYDHDHNYRRATKNEPDFLSSPITIGDNVWIGANCVILRGTRIGSNCVVAAGTVLKGIYGDGLLIYQEKTTKTKTIIVNGS